MLVGVSADAEIKHIRQIAQRSLMELRLGGDADSAVARRIEKAVEAFQDPAQRFHWGLFWPELTDGEASQFRSDPVLSTIATDPMQDGAAAYERISECESPDVWSHNIGVLALIRAVAATENAQTETPDDIEDDLACIPIWRQAFEHLGPMLASDEFWMRKKLWARSLDDARLDESRVGEMRAGFLAEILAPTGNVITTALLDGHATVAKAYVDLLRNSAFDMDRIEETLSRVYKPLSDRVERVITRLRGELADVGEEVNNGRVFRELLANFEAEALADLDVMLAVGDLPGYAEEHARDASAQFLRDLAVQSWNQTQETVVSKKALTLAERFADADSIQQKARHDLSTIGRIDRENAKARRIEALLEELKQAKEGGNTAAELRVLDKLLVLTSGELHDKLASIRTSINPRPTSIIRFLPLSVGKSNEQAFTPFGATEEGRRAYDLIKNGPPKHPGCAAAFLVLLPLAGLAFAGGRALYDITI